MASHTITSLKYELPLQAITEHAIEMCKYFIKQMTPAAHKNIIKPKVNQSNRI